MHYDKIAKVVDLIKKQISQPKFAGYEGKIKKALEMAISHIPHPLFVNFTFLRNTHLARHGHKPSVQQGEKTEEFFPVTA